MLNISREKRTISLPYRKTNWFANVSILNNQYHFNQCSTGRTNHMHSLRVLSILSKLSTPITCGCAILWSTLINGTFRLNQLQTCQMWRFSTEIKSNYKSICWTSSSKHDEQAEKKRKSTKDYDKITFVDIKPGNLKSEQLWFTFAKWAIFYILSRFWIKLCA